MDLNELFQAIARNKPAVSDKELQVIMDGWFKKPERIKEIYSGENVFLYLVLNYDLSHFKTCFGVGFNLIGDMKWENDELCFGSWGEEYLYYSADTGKIWFKDFEVERERFLVFAKDYDSFFNVLVILSEITNYIITAQKIDIEATAQKICLAAGSAEIYAEMKYSLEL